jgi:hypothetical protein
VLVTVRAMCDMTPSSTIVDLFTHDLHFESRGTICADEGRMADRDADWWCFASDDLPRRDRRRRPRRSLGEAPARRRGCVLPARRDPLYLRAAQPDTPDELVRLLPGQAAIVPRDRWHRLEVDEPADLSAVTVRRGTQLEKRTIIYEQGCSQIAAWVMTGSVS